MGLIQRSRAVVLDDAELLLLLVQFLGVGLFGSGGFDRLGLIGTLAAVNVTLCDLDVSLFSELGEEGAKRGLQLLVIERVLNTGEDVLHCRYARHLMIVDLKNGIALFDSNDIGNLASFHRESPVF